MVKVFKEFYQFLKDQNCKSKLHVLDNKFSKAIKAYIKKNEAKIQLVKPHNHCANAVETAVKTGKYHFIDRLNTVAPDCLLHWLRKDAALQVRKSQQRRLGILGA